MVAAHLVEHDHVERRRRRALLAEAADVEAAGVRAAVQQLVQRAGVAVKREDDLGRRRRTAPRSARRDMPCGWTSRGRDRHQVDDVDDADAQLGHVLAQQRGGGDRLLRRHVADAGEHDVGVLAADRVARPLPAPTRRARSARARRRCRGTAAAGCLSMTIEVDVVAAAQAVVGDPTAGSWRPAAGRRARRSPLSEIIVSIRPGPWWLKPLWSLRQQVEVSSTFSDATGARHAQLARRAAATWRAGSPSTPRPSRTPRRSRTGRGGRSAGSPPASPGSCARTAPP